jgi:hypothetical protein
MKHEGFTPGPGTVDVCPDCRKYRDVDRCGSSPLLAENERFRALLARTLGAVTFHERNVYGLPSLASDIRAALKVKS